jgi:hypothetical protein
MNKFLLIMFWISLICSIIISVILIGYKWGYKNGLNSIILTEITLNKTNPNIK